MLDAFAVVRRRAEVLGEGDRSWVLTGRTGMGKTVLLAGLLEGVSGRRWISLRVDARAGASLVWSLSRSLAQALRSAMGRHPEARMRLLLGVFKAFSLTADPSGAVSVGIDIEPIEGVASSGRLPEDLAALFTALGETARELGVGVLVVIDELHALEPEELMALNAAVHEIGQSGVSLPVLLIGAGLPSLPNQLAEATGHAERLYDFRPLDLLDDDSAAEALIVPATERGAEWDEDALRNATAGAGGYPYILQAIGKHVWDNARTSTITAEDVEVGLIGARQEVDDGLYRPRWDRATRAQRDLLRALSSLAGDRPAPVADIAKAMHKARTSDISVARDELIKKGLTYAPQRGLLAFTALGMHDFVVRQP